MGSKISGNKEIPKLFQEVHRRSLSFLVSVDFQRTLERYCQSYITVTPNYQFIQIIFEKNVKLQYSSLHTRKLHISRRRKPFTIQKFCRYRLTILCALFMKENIVTLFTIIFLRNLV